MEVSSTDRVASLQIFNAATGVGTIPIVNVGKFVWVARHWELYIRRWMLIHRGGYAQVDPLSLIRSGTIARA